MILVTGATGNVGAEVVAALVACAEDVRAVARDPARAVLPAGVEVLQGDLELPESLTPALAGSRRVFLLGGWGGMPELLRRIEHADVEHVVLLTSRCVVGGRPDNPVNRMWLDSKAAVRNSGLAWTILRPSGSRSNALRWLSQLRQGDVIRSPWPNVSIAAIDPADIAAVAATVLTEPGHADAAYSLSGPERLAPADQIKPPFIDAFFRFYSQGEFDDSVVLETVQQITGNPPRRFEQWARIHANAAA